MGWVRCVDGLGWGRGRGRDGEVNIKRMGRDEDVPNGEEMNCLMKCHWH